MNFKLTKIGSFMDFSDNSIKNVFENENGEVIEITLLQNRAERDVVCVPTHYFCTLGCKFCHLTNFFSTKTMKKISVDEFNEALVRTLCIENGSELIRRTYKKDILISFMGVGEPLCNIDLIRDVFLTDITKKLGFKNVSYACATMCPKLELLEDLFKVVEEYNIPLKIHFSLHTPNDEERRKIIPSSTANVIDICNALRKYSIFIERSPEILENFEKFHKNLSGVEIHYTLINGVNDSLDNLDTICRILILYGFVIKFIDFNEVGDMAKSRLVDVWKKELSVFGSKVKYYCPPGRNIGSSCGQFTRHYFINTETEEERFEFEGWKLKYGISEKIFNSEDI